jgi:hypothetical protein
MPDNTSYVARMGILAHPETSQNYVVHWHLIPNLAMDLVVPWLGLVVGVETAGRLFIAATMALLVGGTAALQRVLFGRIGLWPLASVMFVYNAALFYGFLNYLFSLGIVLLCFAGWIGSRRRQPVFRLAVFAGLGVVIFTCHLFAFCLFGLLIGSYEAEQLLTTPNRRAQHYRRFAVNLLQFAPALLLWFAVRTAGEPHYTNWGSLAEKLQIFSRPMDFHVFGSNLAPVYEGLAYLAWRTGGLRIAAGMRLPLLAVLVTMVAMPEWLYGSWSADSRLPVAFPFLLIGGSDLRVTRPMLTKCIALASAALLVVRAVGVSIVWHEMDRRYDEFRMAAQEIPRGARLLVARWGIPESGKRIDGVPQSLAELEEFNHDHIGQLAIIDRDAFVPIFGLQLAPVLPAPQNAEVQGFMNLPLGVRRLVGSLDKPADPRWDAAPFEHNYWTDWPRHFDYLVVVDYDRKNNPLPAVLSEMHRGSYFTLYQIHPGSAEPAALALPAPH